MSMPSGAKLGKLVDDRHHYSHGDSSPDATPFHHTHHNDNDNEHDDNDEGSAVITNNYTQPLIHSFAAFHPHSMNTSTSGKWSALKQEFELDNLKKTMPKRHMFDWFALVFCGMMYLMLEKLEPYHRMFYLNDHSIQFPMAKKERVPIALCVVLAVVIPLVFILVTPLFAYRRKNRLHLIHISVMALATSFVFNGVMTNIFKLCLGRTRPDFLDRCQPAQGTPRDKWVTMSVCTNPDNKVVHEGFKSTPSGHTSVSFAGLFFFTLWIGGQLHAFRPGCGVWRPMIALLPVCLAFYIAFSRIEDYRHHYMDVFLGTCIGVLWAVFSYWRQFPWVTNPRCHEPYWSKKYQEQSQQSVQMSNHDDESLRDSGMMV